MAFSGNDAGGFHWEGFESGAPSQRPPKREKKPRKAVKSPAARVLMNLAVTAAVGFLYFYVNLPPINLQAPEFYSCALLLCVVYCGCAVVTSGFQGEGVKGYFKFLRKQCLIPLVAALLLFVTTIVGSLNSYDILNAGKMVVSASAIDKIEEVYSK